MPLDDASHYWIARGQQTFGPYSAQQVHAYLASGNIALTDMIRGERDAEWMPVAFAVNAVPSNVPPPLPGGSGGAGAAVPAGPVAPPTYTPHPQSNVVPRDPAASMAWTSFGCGLFGVLCCPLLPSIPGLICGVLALRKPGIQSQSRTLAITGIVLSIIGILLTIPELLMLPMLVQALNGMNGQGGF